MVTLKNIFEIDSDRFKEIIERAINLDSIIKVQRKTYYNSLFLLGSDGKIHMANKIYKSKYKEILTDSELALFSLYIIFPDDNEFRKLRRNYLNKLDYLAKIYNVSENFISIRYKIALHNINIENEKNDNKVLTKKNND